MTGNTTCVTNTTTNGYRFVFVAKDGFVFSPLGENLTVSAGDYYIDYSKV